MDKLSGRRNPVVRETESVVRETESVVRVTESVVRETDTYIEREYKETYEEIMGREI